MKSEELEELINNDVFPAGDGLPELAETHISWVVTTDKYAYKIKKPVKFSFLDFSTLSKRKFFCEREVILNKRLAGEMYLKYVPIYKKGKGFSLTGEDQNIFEYAVMMKKMDPSKKMDLMLGNKQVDKTLIENLARKISSFHHSAEVINKELKIKDISHRFNDIVDVVPAIRMHLGASFADIAEQSVEISERFLNRNTQLITDRAKAGYVRDLHGDLHAGNIFLYQDPVIFDCIEFSDELRQLDILDEMAFLCMDLEAYGSKDLGFLFYQCYLNYSGIAETEELKRLHLYYKFYRANVRAKVSILNATASADQPAFSIEIQNTLRYIILLKNYGSQLS